MVKYEHRLWIMLTGILLMVFDGSAQDFVAVRDGRFIINDQVYTYVGANFWQGMHLGSLATGNRTKLVQELDHLHALGVDNLRIMAASEGPQDAPWRVQPPLRSNKTDYNQDLLEGLDFLLDEMAGRGMKAVVCLGNFWPWTGGMAQLMSWSTHDPIPYPPPASGGSWIKYMLYTSMFYKDAQARSLYRSHVEKIIRRVNSISGIPYQLDPTIMSWQLANEPRGLIHSRAYRNWIKESAKFIKSIDQRHLVSIGSEGNTPSLLAGNRFAKDHQFADVDYMTAHVWIQNWGWYDPEKAAQTYDRAKQKAISYLNDHLLISEQLNKPLVLEEFGIARDQGSYDPTAGTEWRDHFFRDILEYVAQKASSTTMAGVNFWAWSGSSRPPIPGGFWAVGDPLLGDPPHEHQGWYGVYDTDVATLAIIKRFADEMAQDGH